ncbi:MAG: type III pantothenate kinase [Ignavibacteria bacterium]|nr:type III pantothenate kinase [Ignavibacteria bacterium]
MYHNLLIDIGNSFIKFAGGYSDGKITPVNKIIHQKKNIKTILKSLSNIFNDSKKKIEKIGVTNHYIIQDEPVKLILYNTFKKPIIIINKNLNLPIKINYSSILGSDRICSAVSAYKIFQKYKNILIIDFGTATTYNILIDGIFKYGLICPGIQSSLDNLLENTSLPHTDFTKMNHNILANTTEENISSGIYYQTIYSTEGIIKDYKKKFKGLLVVATGGLSKWITKHTKLIDFYDENLVIKGINYILNLNR